MFKPPLDVNIEIANPPLKKATYQEKKSSSSWSWVFLGHLRGNSLTSEEHLVWPTSGDIGRFSVCPKIDVNFPWNLKKHWFNLETFVSFLRTGYCIVTSNPVCFRGVYGGSRNGNISTTLVNLLSEYSVQLDNFTFTTWKVEGTSLIYCCRLQIASEIGSGDRHRVFHQSVSLECPPTFKNPRSDVSKFYTRIREKDEAISE